MEDQIHPQAGQSSPTWRAAADARRSAPREKQKPVIKNTDLAHRAMMVQAGGWSLMGSLAGLVAGLAFGGIIAGLVAAAVMWLLTFALAMSIAGGTGFFARTILIPSSGSTPRRKEYSFANSLIARGLYQEAVDAFEAEILKNGADPVPYVSIAHLLRDKLDDAPGALKWLSKGLFDSAANESMTLLMARELVELAEARLGQPAKAASAMARLAEQEPGTAAGNYAAQELKRIKQRMAEETGRA